MFPLLKPTLKQHLAYEALREKDVKFVVFGGGAGGGKAQPLDSLILTPKGFVRMGDINVGDKVITPENKISEVIALHPQGKQEIFEIEFIDGAKIQTTEEHLFDCWIASKTKSRAVRSVKEINYIHFSKNVIIPLSNNLCFGNHYKEIDSYLVGALLGDGGLTKNNITFTTGDKEILNYLNVEDNKIIYKKEYQYSIVSNRRNNKGYPVNQLLDKLRKIGIIPIECGDRFVPKVIKYGSLENRKEVLKGLMDTDGYIDERGHCSFTSKSKQLATDVQYLVRSIGGKATLKSRNKFCIYKGERKDCLCYEVYIQTKNNKDLFKLKRKLNRVKPFNRGNSELGRKIVSIKSIGEAEAQCITIEDKKGLYISNDFVVTHNSWLGAEWLLTQCYFYPTSKWFMGRQELSRLMKSSYVTFQKVCSFHKIPRDDWKLNGQYNYIEFKNGSRIDLLDLAYKPSDQLYERFGSLEYTGGWIEEAGEVDFKAFDTLKSRIGRQLNQELNIQSKLLITCNPKKNWLYYNVYKPFKDSSLPDNYVFIQSLYGDNPYTAEEYGKNLAEIKDVATKQRLMFGNWEYDDDPATLMDYDSIVDLFTNTVEEDGRKYLVADIARYGKDKTVIGKWKGLKCYSIEVFEKQGIDQTAERIKQIAKEDKIPYSQILVDEDGVGGGVCDILRGIKGFIANSTPFEVSVNRFKPDNFRNLKTQCAYKLADYVNDHKLSVECVEDMKEKLVEELEQIKSKDIDKDAKLQIIPKDEVKNIIGRSPDFSDMLLMRMYFEFNKATGGVLNSIYDMGIDTVESVEVNRGRIPAIPLQIDIEDDFNTL